LPVLATESSINRLNFILFHIRNSLEQERETRKLDERKTDMGIDKSGCLPLAIARHNCSAVDGRDIARIFVR
jgi:hypothetical protein